MRVVWELELRDAWWRQCLLGVDQTPVGALKRLTILCIYPDGWQLDPIFGAVCQIPPPERVHMSQQLWMGPRYKLAQELLGASALARQMRSELPVRIAHP